MLSDESEALRNEKSIIDFWTKERKELLNWFKRNAVSLGELYEGALKILFEIDEFPGRFRFVAHAVREITNRLPDILSGTRMERLDYVSRLDSIESLWKKFGINLGEEPLINSFNLTQKRTDKMGVPLHLLMEIESLVRDHEKARERPKEKTIRLFKAVDPQQNQLSASLIPIINQWVNLSKWFVGVTHESGLKESKRIDLKEFVNKFELFERTLWALLSNFYKSIEGLDEILEDTNS